MGNSKTKLLNNDDDAMMMIMVMMWKIKLSTCILAMVLLQLFYIQYMCATFKLNMGLEEKSCYIVSSFVFMMS